VQNYLLRSFNEDWPRPRVALTYSIGALSGYAGLLATKL
jgi:hypothetical protein